MARAISFQMPRNEREEQLVRTLEQAPVQHAEAILSALSVLQGMHDRGVLELLRGMLGGGEAILEKVVEAANTPEAIRGIRNLLILSRALAAIDPEVLKKFVNILPETLTDAARAEQVGAPTLWDTFRLLRGRDQVCATVALRSATAFETVAVSPIFPNHLVRTAI